ncbi:hypothetical protein SAMN05444398_12142 [Roseovarius pacificus]|uniref:Uncharacterized protein n=1 Tax=Roseovarius pacificus TaxID=337701 RepID=A0A1M7JPL8_9RHOB|nr:hypothetical protein [Roseovarius pacificus]GGO58489.1 hypothetical protein GCM10011315_28180 [Roseovarius pacificus]SHM54855.1 hypothetical protein SAMN05444398_12142 [Roseovarius pacificus]
MSIETNTPDLLELELGIPRFILWFVMLPVLPVTLIGLANLIGGEFLTALVLLIGLNGAFVAGYIALSERTRLRLDAGSGLVSITRTSRLGMRQWDYPLEVLDSAELDRSHTSQESRTTSKVMLVFRNTRPATRVALSRWGVSGDGPGQIANRINAWLRHHSGDETSAPTHRLSS